jgi:hypothetical protein
MEAHDGSGWNATGYDLKTEPKKCGCKAGPGCRRRQIRIERVGFQDSDASGSSRIDGRLNQYGGDAPLAITDSHIEAGDRPNGRIIHGSKPPSSIEPKQVRAGRQLAPTDGQVAVKGNQARRGPLAHNLMKCLLVRLARSFTILASNPPVHAPASVTSAMPPKKGSQRQARWRASRGEPCRLTWACCCDSRNWELRRC